MSADTYILDFLDIFKTFELITEQSEAKGLIPVRQPQQNAPL